MTSMVMLAALAAVTDFGPEGVGGYPEIDVEGVTASARIRTVYPKDALTHISDLSVTAFDDFSNAMRLIGALRLGEGEKARRYLDLVATPSGTSAHLGPEDVNLTFDDLEMKFFGRR